MCADVNNSNSQAQTGASHAEFGREISNMRETVLMPRRKPTTICIAAICNEGSSLVLATDSMVTNEGLSIQFEHPTRKMTHLSDSCVALTAGDALAHTELFDLVQTKIAALKAPSIVEIVSEIKGCYQSLREQEMKERILIPRGFDGFKQFYEAQRILIPELVFGIQKQIDDYDYGLDIIVAGICAGTAHIYGISNPGTSKCFDALGFHAIGSGLPHAINTVIARGCHEATSLEEALLIVYEAKKTAEKAPGIGARITNICILTPQKLMEFPRNKLEKLHELYEAWVRKESNWMGGVQELLNEIGGPTK